MRHPESAGFSDAPFRTRLDFVVMQVPLRAIFTIQKLLSQLSPLLTKSNAQTDILQNISSQLFELNNNLSKQNGEAVERAKLRLSGWDSIAVTTWKR